MSVAISGTAPPISGTRESYPRNIAALMRTTNLQLKTVGVMGDGRTYEYVVGLRAVTSTDGMTADFYSFDMKFLGETATRIINEVKGVNRVVYDVTSKPPGTIEWE